MSRKRLRQEAFEALAAGEVEVAIRHFEECLKQDTGDAAGYTALGNALKRQGRFAEAVCRHQEAIRLMPQSAELRSNLGGTYLAWGQHGAALRELEHAVSLEPQGVELIFNLGTALHKAGRYAEACARFREVTDVEPGHYRSWTNLGSSLKSMGLIREAVEALERAVSLAPDFAEAQWNLGLGRLTMGEFSAGWELYEWRRQIPEIPITRFNERSWDGSSETSGTLLIHAEQGHGDTFQFIRFIRCARARVGKVVFLCPVPLRKVLEGVEGVDQWVVQGEALPPFDFQIPLMSLPHVLGMGGELSDSASYLEVNPARRAFWRERLSQLTGARVGLCWQGNPRYRDDHLRSIPLEAFEPLMEQEGVSFVALQKEDGLGDLGTLAQRWPLTDWSAELDRDHGSFVDSAALISELSLVITSDTSIAHLAGALGRPVWLLLADVCDWRWGLESTETPWYPTMRLFRQRRSGDWAEVMGRVRQALGDQLRKTSRS